MMFWIHSISINLFVGGWISKDAQKLKDFSKLNDHPVYYLKVSVDFLWNKDKFDQKLFDYVRNNQENS